MSANLFDARDLDILHNLVSKAIQVNSSNIYSDLEAVQTQDILYTPSAYGDHQMGTRENQSPAWPYMPRSCHGQQHSEGVTKTIQRKKPKRVRIAFTTDQLLALEHEFSVRSYITQVQRAVIAKTLNIEEKHVKSWFQNRRMRQKKMSPNSDVGSTTSDFDLNYRVSLPNPPDSVHSCFDYRNLDRHDTSGSVGHQRNQRPVYGYNGYDPYIIEYQDSHIDSTTPNIQIENSCLDSPFHWSDAQLAQLFDF